MIHRRDAIFAVSILVLCSWRDLEISGLAYHVECIPAWPFAVTCIDCNTREQLLTCIFSEERIERRICNVVRHLGTGVTRRDLRQS